MSTARVADPVALVALFLSSAVGKQIIVFDPCVCCGSSGAVLTVVYYAARREDVHIVTCTLGEGGGVIGDLYAQIVVAAADRLGGIVSANSSLRCAALAVGLRCV